ncbi:MAG TPA: hypothetical protein VEW69_05645 [Alphaproteobacteria bacterium]|nr:hypothetical protein [Alphaproteobacteria bacterium]
MPGRVQQLQTRVQELQILANRAERELARLRRSYRYAALLRRGLTAAIVVMAGLALAAMAPGGPRVVTAPFQVMDSGKKLLFEVTNQHEMFVYNSAGNYAQLLAVAPANNNAFFKAQWPDQQYSAAFGVVGGKTPTMGLRYAGDIRLAMAVTGGKPSLELTNGKGIFNLGQGESGGGRLVLMDAAGNNKVQAGITPTGAGAVQVFPNGKGFSFIGLPGTFICGQGCGGH